MTETHIRAATPGDLPALYDICLRTADAGRDGTTLFSDPALPGTFWAAPYGVLEPRFAFILARGEERLGYVVGAPDTAALQDRMARDWWPGARRRFASLAPRTEGDVALLARMAAPEQALPAILARYPGHLHINILPDAQGAGWGRRMVEAEVAALRAAGCPGMFVGVMPGNAAALAFYGRLGFREILCGTAVYLGLDLGGAA